MITSLWENQNFTFSAESHNWKGKRYKIDNYNPDGIYSNQKHSIWLCVKNPDISDIPVGQERGQKGYFGYHGNAKYYRGGFGFEAIISKSNFYFLLSGCINLYECILHVIQAFMSEDNW